jgi:hypothetical protein
MIYYNICIWYILYLYYDILQYVYIMCDILQYYCIYILLILMSKDENFQRISTLI